MAFKLSKRSLARLEGVHPKLQEVAKLAIEQTKVDFGITCGTRTIAEQEENVRTGRSQTMNSKHLPQEDGYSHAIDCVAYVGKDVCWEVQVYDEIADAIVQAARDVGLPIRWGCAWHIPDLRQHNGSMEDAYNAYVDLRRSQGKRPFIDGPHFEIAS
jgi:peptidoglycan L-alanyl-D-glutamate endopeptidase CwlK